jgi:hypothetical protein
MTDISTEQMNEIFNDEEQIMDIFKNVISNDPNPLTQEIHDMLIHGKIDDSLDSKLLELEHIEPYNFLVPAIRHHLGLSIHDDTSCLKFLLELKKHLTSEHDLSIVDTIIRFVNNEDIDTNGDIIACAELLDFMGKVPTEFNNKLLECSLYINSITDDISDEIEIEIEK